jgi:hypothetical protein
VIVHVLVHGESNEAADCRVIGVFADPDLALRHGEGVTENNFRAGVPDMETFPGWHSAHEFEVDGIAAVVGELPPAVETAERDGVAPELCAEIRRLRALLLAG